MHDTRGCVVPEGECIYIRQSTSAYIITIICYTSGTLKMVDAKLSAFLYSNGNVGLYFIIFAW